MIVDILSNKKLNLIITELFVTDRKLKIFLVFITQYYFAAPKNIRSNSTPYFIMKVKFQWDYPSRFRNDLSEEYLN